MFNTHSPHTEFRNIDGGLVVGGIGLVVGAAVGMQCSEWLGFGGAALHMKSLFLHPSYYQAWASANIGAAAAFWTLPTLLGCGIGWSLFSMMSAPRPPYTHISGTRFFRGKQAINQAKIASRTLQKQAGKDGIEIIPGVVLPVKNILQSVMTVGAQGTGKTTIINHLLKKLMARNDHKLMIFDPVKGDFTRWVPGVQAMLSITDRRASHWWLGYDIQSEDDAQEFAAGMIATTQDPIWAKSARAILVTCILKLQAERGDDWSWQHLNELVFSDLATLIEAARTYYPPAKTLLVDGSKTTDSILMNLASDLLPIRRIAQAMARINGKKISMKRWLASEKPGRIIVQMDQEVGTAAAAMARALINVLATQVASIKFHERSGLHCGFIMDEIPQFGRLESVAKLMEIGRSKGIYTIFGFQDWAQVEQIYPRGESAKWDALFGLKIVTGVKSETSKNRVQGMLGEQQVIYTTRTLSGNGGGGNTSKNLGLSLPTARKPVSAQELGTFGLRSGGVEALFIGIGVDALALKIEFPDCPKIREPFKPHAPAIAFTTVASLEAELTAKAGTPAPATPSTDPEIAVLVEEAAKEDEAEATEEVEVVEVLDLLTQPQPEEQQPDADADEDVMEEVESEAAQNAISSVLETATGIDSHLFEAALEVLDFESVTDAEEDLVVTQTVTTTRSRKRKRELDQEA